MKKLIYILFVILTLASCKTKYITVPEYHTDTVYVSNVQRYSIMVKDSVFIYQNGDTVKEYVYKLVYKDRFITDTVYKQSIDTVSVVQTIEVEKKQTFMQRFGIAVFYILCGVFFAIVFFVIRKDKNV